MQTLNQIKEDFYEDISNRYLDYLGEEEKHIIETLTSDIDESGEDISYTKPEAVNIAFQALDGYLMDGNQNTIWEAGYTHGYEVAMQTILNEMIDNGVEELETKIVYILNN